MKKTFGFSRNSRPWKKNSEIRGIPGLPVYKKQCNKEIHFRNHIAVCTRLCLLFILAELAFVALLSGTVWVDSSSPISFILGAMNSGGLVVFKKKIPVFSVLTSKLNMGSGFHQQGLIWHVFRPWGLVFTVDSNKEPMLETSAKHKPLLAKNIPYQPLLIKTQIHKPTNGCALMKKHSKEIEFCPRLLI